LLSWGNIGATKLLALSCRLTSHKVAAKIKFCKKLRGFRSHIYRLTSSWIWQEQISVNRWVDGSNPSRGANYDGVRTMLLAPVSHFGPPPTRASAARR